MFRRRVNSSVDANVSEKYVVFRALKMEIACFSETLASTDEFTRRRNTEEHTHPHRRENLISLFSYLLPFRHSFFLDSLYSFPLLNLSHFVPRRTASAIGTVVKHIIRFSDIRKFFVHFARR